MISNQRSGELEQTRRDLKSYDDAIFSAKLKRQLEYNKLKLAEEKTDSIQVDTQKHILDAIDQQIAGLNEERKKVADRQRQLESIR